MAFSSEAFSFGGFQMDVTTVIASGIYGSKVSFQKGRLEPKSANQSEIGSDFAEKMQNFAVHGVTTGFSVQPRKNTKIKVNYGHSD